RTLWRAHRADHRLRLPARGHSALVLVGALAEPPLFPQDGQAAESRPSRACERARNERRGRLFPRLVGFLGVCAGASAAAAGSALRDRAPGIARPAEIAAVTGELK